MDEQNILANCVWGSVRLVPGELRVRCWLMRHARNFNNRIAHQTIHESKANWYFFSSSKQSDQMLIFNMIKNQFYFCLSCLPLKNKKKKRKKIGIVSKKHWNVLIAAR